MILYYYSHDFICLLFLRIITCRVEMTSKVGVAHNILRALTRAVYLAPPYTQSWIRPCTHTHTQTHTHTHTHTHVHTHTHTHVHTHTHTYTHTHTHTQTHTHTHTQTHTHTHTQTHTHTHSIIITPHYEYCIHMDIIRHTCRHHECQHVLACSSKP